MVAAALTGGRNREPASETSPFRTSSSRRVTLPRTPAFFRQAREARRSAGQVDPLRHLLILVLHSRRVDATTLAVLKHVADLGNQGFASMPYEFRLDD